MANDLDINDLFNSDGTKKILTDLDLIIAKLDKFQKEITETAGVVNSQLAVSVKNLSAQLKEVSKLNLNNAKEIEKYLQVQKIQQNEIKTAKELLLAKEKLKQQEIQTSKLKLQLEQQVKKAKESTEKAEKKKNDAEKKSLDTYQQRRKANNELINQLRAVEAAGKGQSKMFAQLKKGALEERGALDKLDEGFGRHFHNVGNYKQSIQEALGELGLFGNKLDGIANSFKNYLSSIRNAETGTKKFGTVLKGAGILAIVSAVAALKEMGEQQSEVANGLEKATSKTSNFFSTILQNAKQVFQVFSGNPIVSTIAVGSLNKKIQESNKATDELLETTKKYKIELRELNAEIQRRSKYEQDALETSQDQSITLQTRIRKEQEFLKLRTQNLQDEVSIAQKNLDLTSLEIKRQLIRVGVGQEQIDVLTKQNRLTELQSKFTLELGNKYVENVTALKNAQFDLEDFNDEIERRQRERIDERLELELTFLRQKKTGNKQISDDLVNQINNEKNTLDERQKALDQLNKHEQDVTDITLSLIRKAAQERLKIDNEINKEDLLQLKDLENINSEYLVGEKNAQKLYEKINSLALSEKEREILSIQIKKAYDAQSDAIQNQIKLDKEREQLILRIQKINNDIQQNQSDYEKAQEERIQKEIENSGEQIQQEILNKKYFNKASIDLRNGLFKEEENISNKIYETEQKNLDRKLQADIDNATQTITEKKELEAELKKISQENALAELKIEQEKNDKLKDIAKRQAEFEKELRIKQTQEIASNVNTLLGYIGNAQQNRFEKINTDITNQIQRNEDQLQIQRERAAQGQQNDVATYEANAEKLALAQQREAQRQEKMQELLAFIKLFSGYAETDPEHALQKTLKDIALMQVAKLAYLNEGTDYVTASEKTKQLAKPFARGKDKIPAMLAEGEGIVTEAANSQYDGVVRAMNNFSFEDYVRDNYLPNILVAPQKSFAENIYDSAQLNQLIKLNSRMENLEQAIINKRENSYSFDNFGNLITGTVERGMKTTIKHLQKKPRI